MEENMFEIGQYFLGSYPPEVAEFCNARGDCFIKEVEPVDGKRRFQIIPNGVPSLAEVKQSKLDALDFAFRQWYEKDATVASSLGFVADSDSRAMMDVSGLITVLESQPKSSRSTVSFMDHDNVAHDLTLDGLKTVQLEIIQNGQAAYSQKWAFRTQIESAESVEALQAIEITFTGLDFSASA
jgi:hypothetical protein